MHSIDHFIQPLFDFLHLHPGWALLAAYLIAFTESLAIVGSIIPGSVTMTAIGVLIGHGVIPADMTFLWAICGALSGDVVSFWIGAIFKERLYDVWPFRNHPKWLAAGEQFFQRHGGKSIIIGRFVGIMRSIVPMVAGMLSMRFLRFIAAAIPAALGWAVLYLMPGVILGAVALELPPSMATKVIVFVLLIIVILWLVYLLIKAFFTQINQFCQQTSARLWHALARHPRLSWIPRTLSDVHRPLHHRPLYLLIFALLTGLGFLILWAIVGPNSEHFRFNQVIFHLLRSFRDTAGVDIGVVITCLFDPKKMAIFAGLVAIWLCVRRYWWDFIHWVAITLISAGSVWMVKYLMYSPRPMGLFSGPITSSFPSGHTVLAITLFGFIAVILSNKINQRYRWLPYTLTVIIATLVGFSRLYVGAHWLTDLIGSVLLGLSCLLLVTVSYRRKMTSLKPKALYLATGIIFIGLTAIHFPLTIKEQLKDYTPVWPSNQIIVKRWWQQDEIERLPLVRENRLGQPIQAFNIQWLGRLAQIEQQLQRQDWQPLSSHITLLSTLKRIVPKPDHRRLLTFPQLYHNKPPALIMIKMGGPKNAPMVLRLWRSDINVTDSKQTLWLGTVNYPLPYEGVFKHLLHHHHRNKHLFLGATDDFIHYLKDDQWQQVTLPTAQQPDQARMLTWDGKVLLIRH